MTPPDDGTLLPFLLVLAVIWIFAFLGGFMGALVAAERRERGKVGP